MKGSEGEGALNRLYERLLYITLRRPWIAIATPLVVAILTIPVFQRLGSEFMPPLNEGTILYMPGLLPGVTAEDAQRVLQRQNRVFASFPEVARVYGKAGRAATATDPAPLSMIETTVMLKPRNEWRERRRWYSNWAPEWLKRLVLRRLTDDRIPFEDLVAEMNGATALPGVVSSWTMPIRGRIEMLSAGARTPLVVKVLGPDSAKCEQVAENIERVLKSVPKTRSAFAERAQAGYFIDIDIRRDELALRGLQVGDVQEVIGAAVGGIEATQVIDGRARFPVVVRYAEESRNNLEQIARIRIPTANGERTPMGAVSDIRRVSGATMIRTERGMLASSVLVDTDDDDIAGYVEQARKVVEESVALPSGFTIEWGGEYEDMVEVRQRLGFIIPLTICLLLVIVHASTRSWAQTFLIGMAVPFSLIGAVWTLFLLGYKVSVATWIGAIGLIGIDAETAIFMLVFLNLSWDRADREGRLHEENGLVKAVIEGAAKRLRPKLMTVFAALLGFLPSMLVTGAGADATKRVVAPMVGGLIVSFLLELLVYPPVYMLWKRRAMRQQIPEREFAIAGDALSS